MYQKMFSEFEDSSKQAWLDQVMTERKGKDYEELLWRITDRLLVEPYYTQQEFNLLEINELCSNARRNSGWLNQVFIDEKFSQAINVQIRDAIAGGADALWILAGTIELKEENWKEVLGETGTTLFLVFENSERNFRSLSSWIFSHKVRGGFGFDPLSNWMQGSSSMEDCQSLLEVVAKGLPYPTGFYPIMVGSHAFHNAGGDVVQELAFTISLLVQYLDWLTEKNIPVNQAMDSLFISISIGTHYLTETAKLRAFRELYQKIGDAYGLSIHRSVFIHTRTSAFYETEASPTTSFVRKTVQAMAAVTGGCDALTIVPNSGEKSRGEDFVARIARNVSLVMKEEALMGKVADPVAGSYLLEKLTQELVDKAWELFLETEKRGGLVAAFEQGFIQEELNTSWQSKISSDKKGSVLVGVNKYRDPREMDKENAHPVGQAGKDSYFLPIRTLEEGITSLKNL